MKSIKYLVVLACMTLGMTNVAKAQKDLTITVNGVSFTMKYVEGGTFMMGAQKTNTDGQNYESGAREDESPVHSVTVTSFYMGETEVTQALWEAVMSSNPSREICRGDNLPVEKVTWNDCQEFISKLNQLTGKNFRLPTESEWEFAAKGGKKSKGYKYAGSNSVDDVAWNLDNGDRRELYAVKTKLPNELGLYDMSGNVQEWCSDWYGEYSSDSQTNPTGPSDGKYHVLRGGSVFWVGLECRVCFRYKAMPNQTLYYFGLRLALLE